MGAKFSKHDGMGKSSVYFQRSCGIRKVGEGTCRPGLALLIAPGEHFELNKLYMIAHFQHLF